MGIEPLDHIILIGLVSGIVGFVITGLGTLALARLYDYIRWIWEEWRRNDED